MTLLSPAALLLVVVAAPLLLMYMLKLRRQVQVVPSTVLWQRTLDSTQANTPWQRLRSNPLLLLQLLALAALLLALAQPAYTQSRPATGNLVVIVDESYGMQARDVLPSRFAAALQRVRQLAADLTRGGTISLIGMGAQPRLAIADSGDAAAVDAGLGALHPTSDPPNVLGALSLAASLVRDQPHSRILILTSRQSGISALPLQINAPVEIDRLGGALRDLAITGFQTERVAGYTRAQVRIQNFGSAPEGSDLDLFVDGRLADVRPLELGPGEQSSQVWTDLPFAAQRLQAHLARSDDVQIDKDAWSVSPADSPKRVLLVSRGDYFLQTALALDPLTHLTTFQPALYRPASAVRYDLVIFDGFLPRALPAVSSLLVAPPAGRLGELAFKGLRRQVRRSSSLASDVQATGMLSSLLQYADLSDVHVERARLLTYPAWVQPVAASGHVPLLLAGDNGTVRLAIVSFDLQESDWPLRVSFPVVIQNLLRFLAPGLALGAVDLDTGQPLKLFPPHGQRRLEIVLPDGRIDRLRAPFATFTDTKQPGIYLARDESGDAAPFAVNFFPRRPLPAAGPRIVELGAAARGAASRVTVPASFGWAFGFLALLVLLAEWWYAYRQ